MTAKISFSITTYWKRPRGETGMTRVASKRLALGPALDWILSEVPEEAITITPDIEGRTDAVTIRIDWTQVPGEIRNGAA